METSKKKILVINSYFEIGGIESALVNMVNELCKKNAVDLLIYNSVGPMKEKLDSRVNIIEGSFPLRAMGMTPSQALKQKKFPEFVFRAFGSVWSKLFDNRLPVYVATKIQKKLKGYDLAIAYRAETRKNMMQTGYARVLDRCVEAKTKAVWIHYDANQFKEHYVFNQKYYKPIDKIVGVSQSVANAFKEINPDLADKTDYCYNFLDFEAILENSKKEQVVKYPENKFICFSACRLSEEKGLCRAISAMAPVFRENDDVMWYIAGDGPERERIIDVLKSECLEDRIILLGNQTNPYSYMKNSDLLVLVSFHEAAPVVYSEAKALHIPIFSTETSSTREMIKEGIEGFICDNSEDGIREKFSEIINCREKIEQVKENLKDYSASNDESLAKIEDWLE